jgi:3-oxoacyl-[acyl-carrier protein] reductase
MKLGINNKVALVQGASQGLGFAVALELAWEGARVAMVSRDEKRIKLAAARINELTGKDQFLPLACDVSDPVQRKVVLDKIHEKWGPVEILVANSGGPPAGRVDAVSESDWEFAIRNNLVAMKDSAMEVLPDMRSGGFGRIVFITSIAAKQPIQTLVLSNTTRAGLAGFAKTLATEVAAEGITVNSVLPGTHDTERLRELHGDFMDADRIGKDIPAGRLGSPKELAAVVTFLASARASYVTGQAIVVDGGASRTVF